VLVPVTACLFTDPAWWPEPCSAWIRVSHRYNKGHLEPFQTSISNTNTQNQIQAPYVDICIMEHNIEGQIFGIDIGYDVELQYQIS
jgi:hypothetical protein